MKNKSFIKNAYLHLIMGVVMVFVLCPSGILATGQDLNKAQKKLEKISTKIAKNKTKIRRKKVAKTRAEKQLKKLTRILRYTELKLGRAKSKLRIAKNKRRVIKRELGTLHRVYRRKNLDFSERLSEIYKNKHLEFVSLLLTPQAFLAEMDSAYFFKIVMEKDLDRLSELKDQKRLLSFKTKKMEAQVRQISSLKTDIAQKEYQISKKRKQKKKYIRNLKSEIKEIERRNKQLEKSSMELTFLIVQKGKGKVGYYGTGSFIKPVVGWISSRFGKRKHPIFKKWLRHNGVDFAAPRGYKIKASDSGIIIVAGRKRKYKGYGKVTVIDHGMSKTMKKRVSTVYAHQSRILVKEGDYVKKGDEIGWVGSTGYSTGPHLHFEIRLNGIPVNPLRFMRIR
jgi:murein DD-endopeptidase MepM/ murein hydrolase activator NlpD